MPRTKQKSSKIQNVERDKCASLERKGVDHQKQKERNTKLFEGFQTLDEEKKAQAQISMEAKLPTQLGCVELGGSHKKTVPTNICKRGDRFGVHDITYPLSSILKP